MRNDLDCSSWMKLTNNSRLFIRKMLIYFVNLHDIRKSVQLFVSGTTAISGSGEGRKKIRSDEL